MATTSTNEQSTSRSGSQTGSREGRAGQQQTGLARRSGASGLPSLLMDPFGIFAANPFSLFRRMEEEMSRAFSGSGSSGRRDELAVWAPAVEVELRDGNFVITAELPGMNENEVQVEVDNDAVVIQGERRIEHEEKEGDVRRSEIRYGQFYRAIPLPDGADPQQARAEFQNGMLKITVPVAQKKSNARQIPVQSASSQSGSQTSGQSSSKSENKEKAA